MVYDGVGSVISKAREAGAKIYYSDGAKAAIHPYLKIFTVTAPSGQTCSLKSKEGAPYLAALCSDQKAARQIEKHLGAKPHDLIAEPTQTDHPDMPRVKKVHLVDKYV